MKKIAFLAFATTALAACGSSSSPSTSAGSSTGLAVTSTSTGTGAGPETSTGTAAASSSSTGGGVTSTGSSTGAGTSSGTSTGTSTGPVFPFVFHGSYAADISYAPYSGSVGAPTIDTTTLYNNLPTLAVAVPSSGYIGGALVNGTPQDLSTYNALTFWAEASAAITVGNVEIGNDASTTTYQAQWTNNLALTTTWQQFYIPLPVPSDLTSQDGLFGFAQGGQATAVTIWFAEIEYVTLTTGAGGVLGTAQPAIATETLAHQTGDTFPVDGLSVTFPVNGTGETLTPVGANYFTFASSDPKVATVAADGTISAVGVGSTMITATLGAIPAAGVITINVTQASAPTVAAPTPTVAAANVISIFSDAYVDVAVDTYGTTWSNNNAGPNLTSLQVAGVDTEEYANLQYIGIEFWNPGPPIDATAMTDLHVDMWTSTGVTFGIKLVNFGDGGANSGSVTQGEVDFNATSTPAVTDGTWVSFDVPLTTFETAGLTADPNDLSQLLLVGDMSTYYIENIYFHK